MVCWLVQQINVSLASRTLSKLFLSSSWSLILLFFCCVCLFGPTFWGLFHQKMFKLAIQHCFHTSWTYSTYCLLCENMFVCFQIESNEINMFNICANRVHKLIVCYMNCELIIVWEIHGAFPIWIVAWLKFEPAKWHKGTIVSMQQEACFYQNFLYLALRSTSPSFLSKSSCNSIVPPNT